MIAGLPDKLRSRVKRRLRPEQEAALFLSCWIKAPQFVGSLAPSSRRLARAMAAEIDPKGLVVELGGGTGSITRALLETGLPTDRLIVVERDRTLAALLRQRFAGVKILRGDAADLGALLEPLGIDRVDAVVSSLPLLSLPKRTRRRIVDESFALLGAHGIFVQYTYSVAAPLPALEFGLFGEQAERIWRNFPPAVVWRFRRRAQPLAEVA